MVASVALLIWQIYLTTWYQPVQRPLWTIVAESYATNLVVPHNIPSVNSASKLAELLDQSSINPISNQIDGRRNNSQLMLERLETLIPSIQKSRRESGSTGYCMINIVAHGMVDEHGPFLLKDWASNTTEGFAPPQEKDKIRVKSLLQEVVENANGHPAVVVLNCENTDSFQELGIWGNQFSESIIDMESWIENQPNLIVILTTGKSQLNCKDLRANESLFGRIWREGLSDEKMLGNTFNLLQLHEAVARKVTTEAAERFGIIQQPVLLPHGKEGEKRASQVKLVSLKSQKHTSSNLATRPFIGTWRQRLGIGLEPEPETGSQVSEETTIAETIAGIWTDYDRLNKTRPHPASFRPNAWAVYKAAILRLEELTLERSFSSAAQIKALIEPLKAKLEKTSPVQPLFIEPSLAFSEFYLSNEEKKVPQWLATSFDFQWKKPDLDIAKAIAGISEQYEKQKAQLLEKIDPMLGIKPRKSNELQSLDQHASEKKEPSSKDDLKTSKSKESVDFKGSPDQIPVKSEKVSGDPKENVQGNTVTNPPSDIKPDQKLSDPTDPPSRTVTNKSQKSELNPQLRFWLLQLIIDKIRSEATKEISRAMEWVHQIIPANEVLPLELQIIGLASKDLTRIGPENYSTIGHDSVVNFVDLIVASERAFAGLSDDHESQSNFFNHTFYWIRPWNEKAETTFLKSWDYIFSPDASKRNEGLLTQRDAKLQYNAILSRSAKIQKSLEIYYRSIERLPELSFWMIRSHLIDYSNEIHGGNSQNFDRIGNAWDCIRIISKLLENEKNEQISLTTRDQMIREVIGKSTELAGHIDSLENQYMQICRNLINRAEREEIDPTTAILLRHALKIPPKEMDLRNTLVKTFLSLKDRLESKTTIRQTNEFSTQLFEIASILCQNVEELQYNLADEKLILSRYNLADIKKLHSELTSGTKRNFHPLRTLEQKLTSLNDSLSKSEIELDTRISWSLDRIVRVLPLSLIQNTDDNVISVIQSILTSDHLRLFAERVWRSHWGSINETAVPYYQNVCFSLVEEARRVAPDRLSQSRQFQSVLELLKLPCFPVIQMPDHLEVSGEATFSVPIQIRPQSELSQPLGYASILIQRKDPVEIDKNASSSSIFQIDSNSDIEIPFLDNSWESSERNPDHTAGMIRSPLKFGFLFRGNYLEKELITQVSHLPDWRDIRNLPPKGGSLAVRCEPELLEKLGKSTGHVTFLLDCSGSMGVSPGMEWSPEVKYEQAVNAVLETASQLPDGTFISVWVFGEAVGVLKTAAPESTIRQVLPFTQWDSSDRNFLNKIRQQIAYPSCEPWNKSPIILAMEQAKASLVTFDGPKAMIVITDGQDNIYGKDRGDVSTQTAKKNTQPRNVDYAKAIRTMFAETGISVNVVGFKLADEEEEAVEKQFSVVRDLSVPGVFATVRDTRELSSTLVHILRRKLVYRFESESSNIVRIENIDGTEIQPFGTSIQWASPLLLQDVYKVWMDAGKRIEGRFFIQDGKRDLLQLTYDKEQKRFGFQRDSWLRSDFAWRPQVSSQGWRLCWIGSKTGPKHLEMLVALEKEITRSMRAIESTQFNPEPLDIQWKINPNDQHEESLDVEIQRAWNYPSNVWKITVYNWVPTRKMPSIQCLIQPGRPFDTDLSVFEGKDYVNESALKGKVLESNLVQLKIEIFEKQIRWLPDQKLGKNVQQACWVIRTRQNKAKLARADLEFEDSSPIVVEYRHFSQSGISETIVSKPNITRNMDELRMPKAIRFRPLQQAKLQNETNLISLELRDNLPRPSQNDPWPMPIDLPEVSDTKQDRKQQNRGIPPALIDEGKPIFDGAATDLVNPG